MSKLDVCVYHCNKQVVDVSKLEVCVHSCVVQMVDVSKLDIYVYQLHNSCEETEHLDSDDEVVAASHWLLPSTLFDGLWESLVYDDNIKKNVITSLVCCAAFTIDVSSCCVLLYYGI